MHARPHWPRGHLPHVPALARPVVSDRMVRAHARACACTHATPATRSLATRAHACATGGERLHDACMHACTHVHMHARPHWQRGHLPHVPALARPVVSDHMAGARRARTHWAHAYARIGHTATCHTCPRLLDRWWATAWRAHARVRARMHAHTCHTVTCHTCPCTHARTHGAVVPGDRGAMWPASPNSTRGARPLPSTGGSAPSPQAADLAVVGGLSLCTCPVFSWRGVGAAAGGPSPSSGRRGCEVQR